MKRIAVYGSLRKGMYNYTRFMLGAEFLGSQVTSGFDMYSLGSYPCIVEGVNDVLFEVYSVTDEVAATIASMERGAGYDVRQLDTEWGKAEIFVMPKKMLERFSAVYPVLSGDWVEHQTKLEARV